jgi:hypothetical protein
VSDQEHSKCISGLQFYLEKCVEKLLIVSQKCVEIQKLDCVSTSDNVGIFLMMLQKNENDESINFLSKVRE